jgi:TrmH family RNA methyltransferase
MSSNVIKYIKSLAQAKFRQMYNNFIVEGNKNLTMVLNQKIFEIELIAYHKSDLDVEETIKYLKVPKYAIDTKQMKQISQLKSSSSVLIVLKKRKFELSEKANKLFYLDGIQDPGNVGTIIRIADWFGFDGIIRSSDSADFYNPKVIQATMGSFTNIALINEAELTTDLKKYTWYGADMEGQDVKDVKFDQKSIIVMGNEGRGLRDDVLSRIDKKISIAGAERRSAESLNVASAASILAFNLYYN